MSIDLNDPTTCPQCGSEDDPDDDAGAMRAVRLEYLRGEIRAERISFAELAELQVYAEFIDPGDVELLEWAGVPEFPGESCPVCGVGNGDTPTGTVEDGAMQYFTIDRCEDDPWLAYACSRCKAVWTVEANGTTRLRYTCQRCEGMGTIDMDGKPDGNLTCDRCGGAGFDYRQDVANGTWHQ